MTATEVQAYTGMQAFVWLGFHEDVSHEFRVTLPRDRGQAVHVVRAIGCYNAFDPDAAWLIIDGWWDHLMAVDVAREGSVAVYFRFPWTERQYLTNAAAAEHLPFSWAQTRVTADRCVEWAARLTDELLDEHADEISYDRETRTLRAWWD